MISTVPSDVSSLRSASLPVKRGRTSSTSPRRMPLPMERFQALVMDALTVCKRDMAELNRRCVELMEENKRLREENLALMQRLDSYLSSNQSQSVSHPTSSPFQSQNVVSPVSDVEINRSIVIIGVPESLSDSPVERAQNDYHCVNRIFDYLGLECCPVTAYRMGRTIPNRNRLLKVVLPSSWFQKECIKRAPRLRYFPHRGVYIRPSLTKEERDRRRAERLSNSSSAKNINRVVSQVSGNVSVSQSVSLNNAEHINSVDNVCVASSQPVN